MKSPSTLLLLLLAAANCHAGQAQGHALGNCTAIVSDVERLGCFDATAGTPPSPVPPAAQPGAGARAKSASSPAAPGVTELVRRNEAARQERNYSFLISLAEDQQPGQTQVVISAPALDAAAQRTYLAISCVSNISRLQLLAHRPFDRNQISIRLFIDDRPLSAARTWQVLEEGNVADAGRGLVAIELLRQFSSGGRLRVESDYAPVNGLMFDAEGLQGLVAQQREACHW
ncbi:type VI secretion system-associated protein VasI [Achromobacter sp. NPDC058515]|uniref:type VI secretion system-associated protein VasI n=1 Tax=Achromobacter sp. NPDC058515 TaxID=3346533 RepID=UPI0036664FCD